MASELREFSVDKNILVSVMQSQAGTLGKALLEGVMNSIDAGATRVHVKLEKESFSLRDDGRGFQTKEEVLKWFETFGTPHVEGDARFGRYRMGRGQLMSFAVNSWRTGTFRMEVDIRGGNQLGYKLTEKLSPVKGCRIEGQLYEALTDASLDEVVREFTDLVRYAEIPVLLNGRDISRKAASQKWDEENDDAYIKTTRTGDLMVYNLGVLVCKFPNYEYGCGGVIVSKRQLEVNFARNDILRHKCQVWRRISGHMKAVSLRKVSAKASLTRDERDFLAREWSYGNLPSSMDMLMSDIKLFTDATGRHCALSDLKRASQLSVAQGKNGRVGSKLHREGRAFVLSEETLTRFRVYSLEDLLDLLERRASVNLHGRAANLDELALGCTDTYHVLGDEELPQAEQLMLQALRQRHEKFHQWFCAGERSSGMRVLHGGESDVALAWTDGASFIALGLKELHKAVNKGVPGCFELLLTLTHEYCHDSADLESHEHDQVFLAKHHDLIQYHGAKLLRLAEDLHRTYARSAKKHGLVASDSGKTVPAVRVPKPNARELNLALMAKRQLPLSFS